MVPRRFVWKLQSWCGWCRASRRHGQVLAFAVTEGKPYSGANKYVNHFENGALPPVDGSVDIYLQHANPGP